MCNTLIRNSILDYLFSTNVMGGGAQCDWDFRISELVKTLMELIFNPCGEFRWSPEDPVSEIYSHLHVGVPVIFSYLLRSVQMLKREWCAESNGKIPHLIIPRKTATLVPEFAVEDLLLGRTAALVPELGSVRFAIGQNTLNIYIYI